MRPADEAADGCPFSRSETKKCPGLNLTVQTGLSIQTGGTGVGGRKAQLPAASASAQHSCGQREILYKQPHAPTKHSVPVVPFLWELLSETVQPDGAQWHVLAVCSGTFLQIYGSVCQSLSGLVSVIHVPGPDCQPSGCQSGSGIILLFRRSSQRLSVFLRHGPGCAQSRTRKSDHCIPQDPRFHP